MGEDQPGVLVGRADRRPVGRLAYLVLAQGGHRHRIERDRPPAPEIGKNDGSEPELHLNRGELCMTLVQVSVGQARSSRVRSARNTS